VAEKNLGFKKVAGKDEIKHRVDTIKIWLILLKFG
jgi:hypothetical protein